MNRSRAVRKGAPHKINRLAGIAVMTLMFVGVSRADTFATTSYNFQLSADSAGDLGGGGASGILNGTVNVETFCVDYNNNIYVPYSGYNAYLTQITSTGFVASQTRFGEVTQWQTINISGDATDSNTINAANALQRYQMAAYLVSLYNLTSPNLGSVFAYNNGIQEAIWQIMDPASYPGAPVNTGDPTFGLQQAAQWINNPLINHDDFLSGYRIVSDMSMTAGNPLVGGFQEQITFVPEPGLFVAMVLGLIALVGYHRRRQLAAALVAWK